MRRREDVGLGGMCHREKAMPPRSLSGATPLSVTWSSFDVDKTHARYTMQADRGESPRVAIECETIVVIVPVSRSGSLHSQRSRTVADENIERLLKAVTAVSLRPTLILSQKPTPGLQKPNSYKRRRDTKIHPSDSAFPPSNQSALAIK